MGSNVIVKPEVWAEIRRQKALPFTGIPTGFPSWDRACRDEGCGKGLAKGWHITLAGDTGGGKSLMATQLAVNALKAGCSVGFISLEMSLRQLLTRFLAQWSGAPVWRLESGDSYDSEMHEKCEAEFQQHINDAGCNFVLNEDEVDSIEDLMGCAESMIEDGGCDVLITDYMQLLGILDEPEKVYSRTILASRTLTKVAKNSNVASIGLSQYHRMPPNGGRPNKHNLLGGGIVKHDSHQVVHVGQKESDPVEPRKRSRGQIIIDKNRHGPLLDIPVMWSWDSLTCVETEPWDDINRQDKGINK